MSSLLFFKRVFLNKDYWLSVMAALLLLLCSVIYTDSLTGEKYTFISLFYDETVQEQLKYGLISMSNILLGYDKGYLWMFCPIIVGIPCVMSRKTERLVLFRTGKNKYFLSKYFSNLFAGGLIMLMAYVIYALVAMNMVEESIWNIYLVKKLLSVFCWGVVSAVPSIILSEFVRNKYLILCIPFVINYFVNMFIGRIIPPEILKYMSPNSYQILFLNENELIVSNVVIMAALIVACAVIKKLSMERRCDCGQ